MPVPGWAGTNPWDFPQNNPQQRPQGAMPPPMGMQPAPTGLPPQGAQQSPLAGLPGLSGPPGAPPGPPSGTVGLPAGQGNAQGALGMARGGHVSARSSFGGGLRAPGVRKGGVKPMHLSIPLASGGVVRPGTRPVMLRQKYAEGGLVKAAGQVKGAGRLGDSVLVHVNPKEFSEMEAKFGPHSVNPETGLPEFGWFGDLLKIVAPIALMAIPGIGTAVGGALLGAGAAGATTLGDVLLGAGIGGVTGGWKGALAGGLTGGIGANLPANIGGLSTGLTQGLEGAALGAGSSAIQGGNPLTGALLGGATGYLGSALNGSSGNAGATGSPVAPAQSQTMSDPTTSIDDMGIARTVPGSATNTSFSPTGPVAPTGTTAPTAPGNAASSSGSLMSKALPALMLLSLAGQQKNPPVYTTTPPASNAPPYFNQPFAPTAYAPQVNQDALRMLMQNPGAYASQGGPGYYMPGTTGFTFPTPTVMAKGGALRQAHEHLNAPSAAARMGAIKGPGTGISDDVPAKLSNDEFVMDAGTTAMLGEGSSEEGHRRWEQIRQEIRKRAGMKNPKKPMKHVGGALSLLKGAKK